MTFYRKYTIVGLAMVVSAAMALAQGNPQIIAQLDAASARFHNAQATVQYDNYTRVVNEHEVETGSIYVEREPGGEGMGAVFFDNGSKTPAKVVNYGGGIFQLYTPGTKQVDIFKAGANQAKYESFLTLGFGGSGKDLQKEWTIQDQGPEIIDGTKTEKLDLVSKEQSMFTHVTIWVDPTRGVSLKQVFFQPNGDTRTALYKITQLGGTINKKPYAIDPKATKVQH